ncbi:interleukin-1 receptor type 1-like isoform X1 [Conger conger]|uniref:interleukin-1 receptor type 1-like isoform X1 n=1 Tax=Conger conger TaxID=82655 RepID=UPI002A5A7B69|nr:interleukin-1 receptor type 1-like isoform X1 [Conger conger]XP_061090317.1 interleukin-1 receptor type 1-like isoform X1 [Conger conger]XP_061090318.1 interleukin-1 receptor type 1-like isoform X1 [Conger conger]XP_061090319.1 interleukin-1 receptor type 1-like isoform X1 [Conger conger]
MSQTSFIILISAVLLRAAAVGLGERCKDYPAQSYSVRQDATLLNCTLARADIFNYSATPYNISWYDRNGTQLFGHRGRIQVHGGMLWLLNTTLEDAGHYRCVVRTPAQCFEQVSELIVNETMPENCMQPFSTSEKQTTKTNGRLYCHILPTYMAIVNSFSVLWYKGCKLIQDGEKYEFVGNDALQVNNVSPSDAGFYTCHLNFNLSGTMGHIARTIDLQVKVSGCIHDYHVTCPNEEILILQSSLFTDESYQKPLMSQPDNKSVSATYGAPFSKICRVCVPGKAYDTVDVYWVWQKADKSEGFISSNISYRVHQARIKILGNEEEEAGEIERPLNFAEVTEEDFKYTYICMVSSDQELVTGNFTLQRSAPNLCTPLVLVFVGLVLLLGMGAIAYRRLKIDATLWCRASFPSLYPKPGADGKDYDAYVVYPGMCDTASCGQSQPETFVLHTLPHVLEQCCGYKLFIFGRDSLPGEAMADSIRENITRSSRLLLLYTPSAFSAQGREAGVAWDDGALLLAQQTGLHCALVEETLPVLLLELEEVTDCSAFPESLLHLRRKQGAVQWWRVGGAGPQRLCPSSRFWKLVRYHMPARGRPGGGINCTVP